MCWSFEASIVTWIIGLVTSIYLIHRKRKNDVIMGILILVYSSMQLFEALMWYDQNCGKLNIIGTELAYFVLWSHVMAVAIGLYIEYKVKLPLVIGSLFLLAAFILIPKKFECSVKGENRHLRWGFNPDFYMAVFPVVVGLCLYYVKPFKMSLIISSLFIVTFIMSYIYSSKYGTTGSFWCWVCAAFCFVFIAVN